jgi:hypothetical protein
VFAWNRARTALIHELLHLKYTVDEKTVRELAKKLLLYLYTKTILSEFACTPHL